MFSKSVWFCLVSAVLLISLAWTPEIPVFFVFAGFVPLFKAERLLSGQPKSWLYVGLLYLIVFFVVALFAVWWLLYASPAGLLVMLIYALGWSLIGIVFHLVRNKLGAFLGYTAFVVFVLALEFFQYHAEIPLPWLNLGNLFAQSPSWVQWYEWTGVLGGSLWILLLNLLLYKTLFVEKKTQALVPGALFLLFLLLPLFGSLYRLNQYQVMGEPARFLVVQPNIDPYLEKYSGTMPPEEQLQKVLKMAGPEMDSLVRYVVLPETAMTGTNWLHEMDMNPHVIRLRAFLEKHPRTHCITGADLYAVYPAEGFVPPTANRLNDHYFFDAYNAAVQIDTSSDLSYYFKSKLLVGVEMLPYPEYLGFVKRISEKFGGAAFTLATQSEPAVFSDRKQEIHAAPIICYESVFGDYVADYVRKGANVLVIITNDGWWGDTPGYIHHLQYASLRAIETRRYIVRSANTGVSAIINPRGEVIQQIPVWEAGVMKGEVKLQQAATFYVVHGDYLGRIAVLLTVMLLALLLIFSLKASNK